MVFLNENGEGIGYESDSPHPLQLDSYDDVTLQLYQTSGVIALYFSDNYPPQSISLQLWNAKYAGTESYNEWGNGEPIEINENKFFINDAGQDYIYCVYAKWEQGISRYVFRVNSAGKPLAIQNGENDFLYSSEEPDGESYEIGKVTLYSNGAEYEPYIHFLYSGQLTDNGMLFADGILLSLEDVSNTLPTIQYSDDMKDIVDGKDYMHTRYSLYNDSFEPIYSYERY